MVRTKILRMISVSYKSIGYSVPTTLASPRIHVIFLFCSALISLEFAAIGLGATPVSPVNYVLRDQLLRRSLRQQQRLTNGAPMVPVMDCSLLEISRRKEYQRFWHSKSESLCLFLGSFYLPSKSKVNVYWHSSIWHFKIVSQFCSATLACRENYCTHSCVSKLSQK